ncbi:MAG: DMT family transporter [Ectobacillus sp.]
MTGYMLVMGSVVLFIIGLCAEPNGIESMKGASGAIWAVFFASAIIATALGHMMYNYAIGKVGAAAAAIFINLNPFFSLVGAVIFLGERIAASQVIGFMLILCGVLLGSGSFEEAVQKRKRKIDVKREKPA